MHSLHTLGRAAAALGLVTAALVSTATAQFPRVRTILSNGSTDTRYDIVILGDGYQVQEENRFDSDCAGFIQALMQKEPYQSHGTMINVHTVFRPSNQSGADQPDVTPPIYVDTVYDATYNTGNTPRCLYIQNTSLALQDAARAPATEGRVLVFVNSGRYGGCASTFAVSYNGTSRNEVQIHELGHSVGRLADEYGGNNSTYSGPEPGQVNVTAERTGSKWSDWWGVGGISSFEGGRYYNRGIWRPRQNCLMRALNQTLCAVCQENSLLELSRATEILSGRSPASTQTIRILRPNTQVFQATVTPVSTNLNHSVFWTVDGQVAQVGQIGANSFTFDTTQYPLGAHQIELVVDVTTPFVRRDPRDLLDSAEVWNVEVTDNLPDLRPVRITVPSGTLQQLGTPMTFDIEIENRGYQPASGYDIELFLSDSLAIPPETSSYLGRIAGPTLQPNTSMTFTHTVDLPHGVRPAVLFLGAVVDRDNRVVELDENNNQTLVGGVFSAPPCQPMLEFRDAFTYPTDARTLSLSGDPTARPTVVWACQPNTNYVVGWGCSGTMPGLTLPGSAGLTLPLNPDACTDLLLTQLNTTLFGQFLGVTDIHGIGRATMDLTGIPYPGVDLNGHFAAAFFDANGDAIAVTRPVSIDIVQ